MEQQKHFRKKNIYIGEKDEKCRRGSKRQCLSNSCFKVSKWTPLYLFHLSCKDQTYISVKKEIILVVQGNISEVQINI